MLSGSALPPSTDDPGPGIAVSGMASGLNPEAALAVQAVDLARAKTTPFQVQSVLLFLSQEFAQNPMPAIRAVQQATGCTQVAGCSAQGICTDEDWVVDQPAAAVLLLGGGFSLAPRHPAADEWALNLAAPNAVNTHWLHAPGKRFGGVSGDATGQGPFRVWGGGRLQDSGHSEMVVTQAAVTLAVSQGVRMLGEPLPVTACEDWDVHSLSGTPAALALRRQLPLEWRDEPELPLHLLLAGITRGDPGQALASGNYRLHPVIAAHANQAVTVSTRLRAGEHLFWALRQPLVAENDMRAVLQQVPLQAPAFGLYFPCMGRGPYFYGGQDRDWLLLRQRFPGMPFAGFYGNGEIAWHHQENQLLQYAAVTALFESQSILKG